MKKLTSILLLQCCALAATSLLAQTNRVTIFPDEDALTPENLKLVWPATPGIRYEVKQSTNLQSWSTAPGYPATANGPAQQMPFLTEGDARFFQVRELDEQPPGIVNQYPQDGGFAVPRFADLTIQLSDVTGIDTNSIRLTVGSLGTFSLTNAQLTLSNGVLTFINGGSIPLGAWGTNVLATLVAADTLGNAGTNTWTFTLELQPQVVTNLFVFGSPQAQRTGQQIGNIPTAALAARSGPIPMGAGDPWTLELVDTNRLVLSYTNTPPGITNDTYVCNLTPTTPDEIFYRKVISVSNAPASKLLTLYTTNVPLAEILNEGSSSVSAESVIYELDTNNIIIRAFSFEHEIVFGSIGINTNKTLYDQDGITLTLQEAKFLFTPSLTLSFETRFFQLQRFEAALHGRLETALVPQLTITGTLADTKNFNLYSHKLVVYVGQAGPLPIWLDFNFSLSAEVGYNLSANATMSTGVRQNVDMSFGVDYVKGRAPELQGNHPVTPEPMELIPFTYEINGSASAYATIIPQIDVRVNSLAGLYANVDPRVEVSGNATVSDGQLTNANLCVVADADLNVGLNVLGLGNIEPALASFKVFSRDWCTNYPPPAQLTIEEQPRSQEVVVGSSVTFSVNAVSSQAINYQWYFNDVPLPGKTGTSLILNNVLLGYAGQYHVRLTSEGQTLWSSIATLTVVPASLQSGLVAYYPFNGNANDASGNGHNGITNGVSPAADRYGSPNAAFRFDGVNDFVEVPDNPVWAFGTNEFTIELWANFATNSGTRAFVASDTGSGVQDKWIFWLESGVLRFYNVSTIAGDANIGTASFTPTPGQWYHLALTRGGTNYTFYIDGSAVSTNSDTRPVPDANASLTIGQAEGQFFFNGLIDKVSIYNRALSASEIQQLYNLSLPPAPSGMALIPAGNFTMGDTFNEGWSEELPLHTVYVSAFYMDRYEVTKALWDEVKAWNGGNGYSYGNAGSGKAANHPVHTINWYDMVKWCNARSQKEGLVPCYYTDAGLTLVYKTGQVAPYVKWNANGYRLPTEAEWEKAARGGASGQRFPWSDTDNITHSRANYNANYSVSYDLSYPAGYHPTFFTGGPPYTSPVGYFGANGYGLYDMAGNVWEWCWDWFGYYSSSPQTDPRGPASGSRRVIRGGSWNDGAIYCRTAERADYWTDSGISNLGFRCVLPPGQ